MERHEQVLKSPVENIYSVLRKKRPHKYEHPTPLTILPNTQTTVKCQPVCRGHRVCGHLQCTLPSTTPTGSLNFARPKRLNRTQPAQQTWNHSVPTSICRAFHQAERTSLKNPSTKWRGTMKLGPYKRLDGRQFCLHLRLNTRGP